MINVSKIKRGVYKVVVGEAEWQLLRKIGDGYGMSPTTALGACINRGLDEHTAALRQGEEHDNHAEDKDVSNDGDTSESVTGVTDGDNS